MSLPGKSRSAAIWLLLAIALLCRASVPSGWMPLAGDDGLRIVLCTGTGPVEIAPEPGPSDDGHHQDHRGNGGGEPDPCPYGLALGKSFDLNSFPAPGPPPKVSAALAAPSPVAARLAARRGLMPPARGPPAFA